ncbi:hypothetical protein BOTBODRAFT_52762 [Botryobasidium botryosum FD-172 SS1]|uniref:Uncharacterized protein n=1 Tax=Botryobasidium botryosum (strain FD-172 SS1) TaxID=930990 RepID=A0A067N2F4_BOTB1|nr:hypothetical protein BOTBODRAFT_52762 [Botryobasidium botryosum FD-172 SS1]
MLEGAKGPVLLTALMKARIAHRFFQVKMRSRNTLNAPLAVSLLCATKTALCASKRRFAAGSASITGRSRHIPFSVQERGQELELEPTKRRRTHPSTSSKAPSSGC